MPAALLTSGRTAVARDVFCYAASVFGRETLVGRDFKRMYTSTMYTMLLRVLQSLDCCSLRM
jgi:hypothetical protein